MSRDCSPPLLLPLFPAVSTGRVTAAQAVERMRLWDPAGGHNATGGRLADSEHFAAGARPPAEVSAPARPRVFLNMASTADGRASLGGRAGGIGNRADRELFHALRASVDAIMVGAGTARAEHYHRLVRDGRRRQLRVARGLSEEPLACIVSASLALSAEDVPLLGDPAARVVMLTPSDGGVLHDASHANGDNASVEDSHAGAARAGDADLGRAHARPVEYVRAARDGALDLPAALAELGARWGVRTVLCEGGPHLNGDLLRAGVVDEVFLSLAPQLGGGGAGEPRIVSGVEFDRPVELELAGALECESLLLLRYRVSR